MSNWSIVIAFGITDPVEACLKLIAPQRAMTKHDRLHG